MKLPDCVELEMRMAVLMAEQERSGFRFDMGAAKEDAVRASHVISMVEGRIAERINGVVSLRKCHGILHSFAI